MWNTSPTIEWFIWIVRPTEIPESDVYVCESTYDEGKKLIKRNIQGQGLRKFTHSQLVTPDEIYHFKNAFTPIKVTKHFVHNYHNKLNVLILKWM